MEEGLLKKEEEERYSFKEYFAAAFSNTEEMMRRIVKKPRILFFLAMALIIAATGAISSYAAYTRVRVSVIWPENISEDVRSLMEYGIKLSTDPIFISSTTAVMTPIVYAVGAIVIWIIGLMRAKISSVLTAMGIIGVPSILSNLFKAVASSLSPIREVVIDLRQGTLSGTPPLNYTDLLMEIVFLPWEAYLMYQLFRSGMGRSVRGSIASVLIAEAIKYVWTFAGLIRL